MGLEYRVDGFSATAVWPEAGNTVSKKADRLVGSVAFETGSNCDIGADREGRSDAGAAAGCSAARVVAYIQAPDFPCIGARSAVNRKRAKFGEYADLGGGRDIVRLCADLKAFSEEFPDPGNEPVTFVAMFEQPVASEDDFETLLWRHLRAMHDHDRRTFAWDPLVSANPSSEAFSFSIAGRAFFVVGLSPVSSRLSRRAPMPCLVFNFHNQFEALRTSGKYLGMQKAVRQRDAALQGSINPVLARFGEASEARQYAGRAVADDWQCPFRQHE